YSRVHRFELSGAPERCPGVSRHTRWGCQFFRRLKFIGKVGKMNFMVPSIRFGKLFAEIVFTLIISSPILLLNG
ncbi:MAG: hypothetical protein WAV08_13655, partial [Desulfobacterales bacterium]